MNIIVELKSDQGTPVGQVVAAAKQFKTGSRGFFGMTKLEIDGRRYQVQVQMVEIGSKGGAPSE